MTELGGYHDRVARVDLSSGDIVYEGIDDEDVKKYIGVRGLGVEYAFDKGPDVDPPGPDNLLVFMTGPLTDTQTVMSGQIVVATKSPLTGIVAGSYHGGQSGAWLKRSGLDDLLFVGKAERPNYAVVEDGELMLHDAEHLWGKGAYETIEEFEDEVEGSLDKNPSIMTIGPGGENEVKCGHTVSEDNRASGHGGTRAVTGLKNLKAIVVKPGTWMPKPADADAFKQDYQQVMQLIHESEVTAPNEGDLSLYRTNALMNAGEEFDDLPTKNGKYTSTAAMRGAEGADVDSKRVSGENVRENILADEPTCHSCPVACKKEVGVSVMYKGEEMNVRSESYEYESAYALGPNFGHTERDKIAVMVDRCNDIGVNTIEVSNIMVVAMEMSEQGRPDGLSEQLDWGGTECMIDLITEITNRDDDLADVFAEGANGLAERFDAHGNSLAVKGQTTSAYDPHCMKGMGIGYATSNRGMCHLRGYTPPVEILGILGKHDPHEWRGKGEFVALLQGTYAISDSSDICKFSVFAEGIEGYVLQYNGMTGRDVTEEELLETGDRTYMLEWYYNSLAGFDGVDDSLPEHFVEGDGAMSGQGASEGQLCELDEMKEEYHACRQWVDGIVPDERLDELGTDIGPGTGVSRGDSSAPADD